MFTAKLNDATETFHIPLTHAQPPPFSASTHQRGKFIKTDERTLAHHSHPLSIICIRFLSWCYVFCELGLMYDDMCLPLQCRTEQRHCPRIRCAPLFIPLSCKPLAALILLLFPQFVFSRMSYNRNHAVCGLCRFVFHLVICL